MKYYFNFTLIANLKTETLIGCIRKMQGYLRRVPLKDKRYLETVGFYYFMVTRRYVNVSYCDHMD